MNNVQNNADLFIMLINKIRLISFATEVVLYLSYHFLELKQSKNLVKILNIVANKKISMVEKYMLNLFVRIINTYHIQVYVFLKCGIEKNQIIQFLLKQVRKIATLFVMLTKIVMRSIGISQRNNVNFGNIHLESKSKVIKSTTFVGLRLN